MTLARVQVVNPAVIRLLNRLSDYLFVLSRTLPGVGGGPSEVLWTPAARRG